jgi:hypothetical protein
LAGIHATAKFVAASPERAVEFGFLDRQSIAPVTPSPAARHA